MAKPASDSWASLALKRDGGLAAGATTGGISLFIVGLRSLPLLTD